jgi:hypothetical protein
LAGNTGDVTIVISRPASSGGWWSSRIKDVCPNGDYSESYYDGECGISPTDKEQVREEILQELWLIDSVSDVHGAADEDDGSLVDEWNTWLLSVYEWAKKYNLTSMQTYEAFRPSDAITRAEMAKILVLYVERFTNNTSSSNEACYQFWDIEEINSELQYYITQSCQLWLMGRNADRTEVKTLFNPNDSLSRAEVATILSRMLRWDTNKGSEEYWYHSHLLALRKKDIITDDHDPMRLESRKSVLTMFMEI